jgi:hypothetical protein
MPSASTRPRSPADNKSGEAHNNLAVVYLETGPILRARFKTTIECGEEDGHQVNPGELR